jgi:hypothetical protein
MKKVYVVELQSQHDGGHTEGVFSNENNARNYIEKQRDFTKWDPEDNTSTLMPGDDFWYTYDEFIIDEN